MSAVFLSYAHIDAAIADEIAEILDEVRVSYFRDVKSIDWGQDIENEVRVALHNCAAIVVVISPASLESAWVPYELGHGRALRKDILPFLTHPSLKLPVYLSRLSYVTTLDQVRGYFADYSIAVEAAETAAILQPTVTALADRNCDAVTGKWTGQAHQQRGPEGHPIDFDVSLELTAEGNILFGTLRIVMPYRGKQVDVTFDVTGGFVGGRFAWVNYVAPRKDRPHFGTVIFDLTKDPDKLIGEYTGYGALTDGIVSGYAHLKQTK